MKTWNLENLLLHPVTKKQSVNFLNNPSQVLLIVGTPGAGRHNLAQVIAGNLLGIDTDRLGEYPYITEIQVEDGKSEISIDSVREIIASLKLKALNNKPFSRVVLINNAEMASQEAQNALLKILEEPPSSCLFILTAISVKSVLPTISSRARAITVHPVS